MNRMATAAAHIHRQVICIGDVHGNLHKLTSLWTTINNTLGEDVVRHASVVFLGDMCDRGENTQSVLDWCIQLQQQRGANITRFVMGNHDFGMSAFLGLIPVPQGFDLKATLNPKYVDGYFKGDVDGGMHYQGRRWAGSHASSCNTTFESYGVQWDAELSQHTRSLFCDAVPHEHKEFLRALPWVQDMEVPWAPYRLICVHAGLNPEESGEVQLAALKNRDIGAKVLQKEYGRFDCFSGREDVLAVPPDLENEALVVSGHHGFRRVEKNRIIMDRSAGKSTWYPPLEAIVLPQRLIISSCGRVEQLE